MRWTPAVIMLIFTLFLPADVMAVNDRNPSETQRQVVVAKPAMREITLTGYTRARYVMDIVSEEAGRCMKVTADVGDRIGANSIFAVLDTTFIDKQYLLLSSRVWVRVLLSSNTGRWTDLSRSRLSLLIMSCMIATRLGSCDPTRRRQAPRD